MSYKRLSGSQRRVELANLIEEQQKELKTESRDVDSKGLTNSFQKGKKGVFVGKMGEFREKAVVSLNKKQNRPKYYKNKSERRKWWSNLTAGQQQTYIEQRQAKKDEYRKNHPKELLRFNPKYPWMTDGVKPANKAQWLKTIETKNPWLSVA